MNTPLFTPEYLVELREQFARPYAENALIGAVRMALDNGMPDRARALIAVYDEVEAALKLEAQSHV